MVIKGFNMTLGRLQRLNEELEELRYCSEQGIPILIEGKKDEEALQELGIHGKFIKISGSSSNLSEIADSVARSSSMVIILTDFDRKGNQLAKRLRREIESLGCYPNLQIRKRIMGMTRKYIKDIQSLPKYIQRLEMEISPYPFQYNSIY
ncbi:MAG: toprim domain-containing protein [Methanobacteriales archaeon]|nr:MAG: hypothetical protein XD44_1052 [Methanobacteriaceae archaeon 41_258]